MAKFMHDGNLVDSPLTPDVVSYKQWNGLPDTANVKLVTEAPVTIEGEVEAPDGDITKAVKPRSRR